MTAREMQDQKVISGLDTAVTKEREAIAEVVQYLAQVGDKKLYLKQAYSSLFQYCVEKLHYSESAAYRRIHAARMAQKFPQVIWLLRDGTIHLTTLTLIAPHATAENVDQILCQVTHKTKREVEKILAAMFPSTQTVPDQIRKLPSPVFAPFAYAPGATPGTASFVEVRRLPGVALAKTGYNPPPSRRDVVLPITDTQIKITFQTNATFAKKLDRAKEILRHKYPQAKIEDVLGEALEYFLNHKDPLRKAAKVSTNPRIPPQTTSRYIPKAIRTSVWKRDNGQCTYCSSDGKRCSERGGLDLDHVHRAPCKRILNRPSKMRSLSRSRATRKEVVNFLWVSAEELQKPNNLKRRWESPFAFLAGHQRVLW